MTIAQQLEQKGFRKGFEETYAKYFIQGKRQAALDIAYNMLQHGFDRNTVMKMTGLTEDDLAISINR